MDTTVHVRSRSHLTIALAAGAVFALGLGLRQSLPLFISLLNSHTGVGYATVSLAFGVSQLMWGVAQPVAGAIADRWGPRPVMIAGATLFAAAVAATPAADNAMALMLLIGVVASAPRGWRHARIEATPARVLLEDDGFLAPLEAQGVPEPRMHVWMKPAVSWEPVADGLPQHDTHP